MMECVKQDLYRRFGRSEFSLFELFKISHIPQVQFISTKRKVDHYRDKNKILYLFYSYKYRKLKIKYNVDFPASVKIGKGFLIEHIGGIAVNPDTIIGDNCALYNGVTIGIEKRGERQGVPKIGSQVWIGANSVIVGRIRIGNNVLIAPGAFVNFDVPDNSIVVGNPGNIISRVDATKAYIENLVWRIL